MINSFIHNCKNKILQLKNPINYLSSTFAPAASNLALISSASFLFTPALTSFGAPSTKSFASFKPNEVTALTSFITLIFLSPAAANTIVNSSFSSAGAAPPAAAAGAATADAAVTPHFSSNCFDSSAASTTVKLD